MKDSQKEAGCSKPEVENMSFIECFLETAAHSEFVSEFNRLTGHNLGFSTKRKQIERMVDKSTGYEQEIQAKENDNISAFAAFVYEYVWLPVFKSAKA